MVTLAVGEEYRASVQLGLQNKQEYCEKHGYDFICGDKSLDTSRHIVWSKILLILDVMKNSAYKWIFLSDADALVMNTGLCIEDLIDEDYDLIINHDFNGFNSGHFLIRNCARSRKLLQEAYKHTEFLDHPEWEQGAILATLQENRAYLSRTKIIPQRLMNSFPDVLGSLLQGTYQPGDFILHFAGIREPALLKKYFEHYYPLASDQTKILTYEHYLGIHDIIQVPVDSPIYNWSTNAQNEQYAIELKKHQNIKTVAQIYVSNGLLSEVFFKHCPQLKLFRAYVHNKRYNPFCRAACDYLSRKYRVQWQESSDESLYNMVNPDTRFDLIHLRTRSFDSWLQAKKLAHKETVVWIEHYNLPEVQQMVYMAVRNNLLKVVAVHSSGDQKEFRAWVEARYL